MYNYFLLIGDLISFNEERFMLLLEEPFPSLEGIKETNILPIVIPNSSYFTILSMVGIGNKIAVKGRIRMTKNKNDFDIQLVAERIMSMKEEEK